MANSGTGRSHHEWFGDYRSISVAFSQNQTVREESTSGGVITTVLMTALENNIIDAAVVVGNDSQQPWRYKVKIAQTKEEILDSSGSKYVFIPVGEFLEKIKEDHRRLAVVGTPCNIRVIRNLQKANKMGNVVLLIGIFCGYDIPLEATEFMLQKLEISKEDVRRLKYRGGKYPGGFWVETTAGQIISLPKHYYDFIDLMFVPDGCLKCKDYTSEMADISVGDGWGFGKSSVVIVRTDLGEKLMSSKDIERTAISVEQFIKMHGHNLKHKKIGDSRMRTFIRKQLKRYGKLIPFRLLGLLAGVRRKILE